MNGNKTYSWKTIWLIVLVALMTGCGVKRQTVQTVEDVPETETPAWHTCLIQGARITVVTPDNRISANATMQVVRDSMLVISIQPLLGIEMMRIEATPTEIIGIDKIHGQYAITGFNDINRKLTPPLNWDELQQICSAELPLGSEKARLYYTFGDDLFELTISYPMRQTDIPVRIGHQPLQRYTQIDISKWL